MATYDLKNIEKCYVFGNITVSLSSILSMVIGNKPKNEKKQRRSSTLANRLRKPIMDKPKYDNSIIFIVGDCGFNNNSLEQVNGMLETYNNELSKLNTYVLLIRGFNEQKEWFDGKTINFSNIIGLNDYSLVKTKRINILCIGGDISISKSWGGVTTDSEKGKTKDTKPLFNDKAIKDILSKNAIHAVISPSSPSFINPSSNTLGNTVWGRKDKKALCDVLECRNTMDKIYSSLTSDFENKPYIWLCGNFSMTSVDSMNDIMFYTLTSNSEIDILESMFNYLSKLEDMECDDCELPPNGVNATSKKNKHPNFNRYNKPIDWENIVGEINQDGADDILFNDGGEDGEYNLINELAMR